MSSFLGKIIRWSLRRSPWILHFNSGSCNACDIEILAALTPRFDVERFGIKIKASPRHADILVVTGPVTKQQEPRLKRIYEQMPEPKYVIAVGTCTTWGSVFHGSYSTLDGVYKAIPVDVYVPGCPPRPEAIILGFAKLFEKIERGED